MTPAIQTEDLHISLSGKEILRGISMSVRSGEYVSIIGPNGAGKSTLMRCLLGMYPYEGSVKISGSECEQTDPKELAKTVSYVPQTHDIEFPLPVFDFVMMGRYPYLSPLAPAQKKDIDAVEKAMEITGTTVFRDRLMRTLSGGERQKVYIAAALAQETPIMLLDEPATFLDWKHQADIMQLLKKINTDCGATVLAVNHDLNSAAHWSDRIIALKDGSVLLDGIPEKIIQPGPLKQLFETVFIQKTTLAPVAKE
ncbi:MAG TPA: ABC transporter ATP-binding protein [Tichowtungia sp.]|nr:ABC transporter ATP-binding protein [Tichowtungia sp.]